MKDPREKLFTWYNSNLSMASRLDTFLISRFLCKQVISCEIRPCVYSDHDFVFLEVNLHTVNRWGLGTWKFNNSLLQEETFCSAVSDLIEHFMQFRSSFPSDSVMWDLLKKNLSCLLLIILGRGGESSPGKRSLQSIV